MSLIEDKDYSFLNSRIQTYDYQNLEKFKTYYDYVRFMYREISKEYKNEYVFKNTLINELLIKNYGLKDTLAINEFRVGGSVADIVMFNGVSRAFEIKTEFDSNRRLRSQLNNYRRIFNQCYVVTHEKLADLYLQEDEKIGVIILKEQGASLKLEEIRGAQVNVKLEIDTLIRSIRTYEYKAIVRDYFEELPPMNSFNMFEICKNMMEDIPSDILNELFINQLKKRRNSLINLKLVKKELRQVGLAMKIKENTNQRLNSMLSQPIKPTI